MKSLPQRVENENTYRNEMYLLNGFDLMASAGRPRVSVRIHQSDRAGLGGRHKDSSHILMEDSG